MENLGQIMCFKQAFKIAVLWVPVYAEEPKCSSKFLLHPQERKVCFSVPSLEFNLKCCLPLLLCHSGNLKEVLEASRTVSQKQPGQGFAHVITVKYEKVMDYKTSQGKAMKFRKS